MKRLLLLAGCVFAMVQASAQELPKSFFVTAGVGGSIQKDDYGSKVKALKLSPTINYQLNERWTIGLFVNYTRASENSESYSQTGNGYSSYYRQYDSKERSWHFGPQVRYYQPIVNRLYIFGEAQTGYRSETMEATQKLSSYYNSPDNPELMYTSSNTVRAEASAIQAVVAPGLVYFIKPKFGIELKASVVNYTYGLKNSVTPQEKSDYRNFTTDFSLANTQFGASFYF